MPLMKEQSKTEQIPKLDSQPSNQKGLVSIVGSLLPLAPVLFEQWTGQKIPPMTGTLAEMNTALSTLQLSLSQVLQNQQQLWNKLEALEKSAHSSLSSLTSQVQNIRLTHTRETKSIDYNQPRLEKDFTEE